MKILADKALKKELKRAYKLYIEGDVEAFDQTLESIVLCFSLHPHKMAEEIRRVLGDKKRRL